MKCILIFGFKVLDIRILMLSNRSSIDIYAHKPVKTPRSPVEVEGEDGLHEALRHHVVEHGRHAVHGDAATHATSNVGHACRPSLGGGHDTVRPTIRSLIFVYLYCSIITETKKKSSDIQTGQSTVLSLPVTSSDI